MLSRDEANAKTVDIIKESVITSQLMEIDPLIEQAVKNGNFSVYVNFCLSDLTKQRLKELGYSVTFGDRYNEVNYNISWE